MLFAFSATSVFPLAAKASACCAISASVPFSPKNSLFFVINAFNSSVSFALFIAEIICPSVLAFIILL